jgi:hypothetical protein
MAKKIDDLEYSIINADLDILKDKIDSVGKELKFISRISYVLYAFIAISCLKIIFFK